MALNLVMYSNGFSVDSELSSALLSLARFMEDDSVASIEVTELDGNPVLYSTYYKKLKNISLTVQTYFSEKEESYPVIISLNL